MRDEETGSFWQQISGKAVSGPLRGQQLELVRSEELSFGLWRSENPRGLVLTPMAQFTEEYEPKDWEKRMLRARTVVDTRDSGLAPRSLMLGADWQGVSRAYPLERVLVQKLVQDQIGSVPVIVVVGPDRQSVRAFVAKGSDYYRREDGTIMDSTTGSEWNFKGCAVAGPAAGRCLESVPLLKDYWFDWEVVSSANLGVFQIVRVMDEQPEGHQFTMLLQSWQQGDVAALNQLTDLVYGELHQLAEGYLRREQHNLTLQPTALVHEAYLRLAAQNLPDWKSRTHFYGVAAQLMRQVLVDFARKRRADKRGWGSAKVSFDEAFHTADAGDSDLLELNDALEELAKFDERKARIVELRFFGGLTIEETAHVLELSDATVSREQRLAQAWLHRQLGRGGSS